MSWLTELRLAKFRGVEFYVHASDMKGGRTIVTHEVPGSEKRPFKEDMGSAGRSHAVEAYVYGDDYQTALRTLLDALDKPGAGELNHPYVGLVVCVVDGEFSVRQSGDEGGWAVVTVTFAETSEQPAAPAAVSTDAGAALVSKVASIKMKVGLAFADGGRGLLSEGITGATFFAALDQLNAVGQEMEDALAAVAVPGALLAQFQRQLTSPLVRAADFISDPANFFPALVNSLFAGLAAALTSPDSLVAQPVAVLLKLTGPVAVPEDADEEAQAIAPLLGLLVQRGALLAASELLPSQAFESYESAVAGRQAVIDAISAHSAEAADDTYADFADLRGAVARAVPAADSALPRLQQYTPAVGVPSLVLAYRLYGDVAAEADLVARNRIPNPAFVLGGRALEVLSRG